MGAMNSTKKVFYYFIDESGFHVNGIALLCCVVLDDPEIARSRINKLREDILHDPRLENIITPFAEKGFHYSSDHLEIRNKFIELLNELTFQAYICFDPYVADLSFKNTYAHLFGRLIIDRLRDHKTGVINITFEQHSEIRQQDLAAIVASKIEVINNSERTSFRGEYTLRSSGKDEVCLSMADYICGIFSDYYGELHKATPTTAEALAKRNFENLRNKIRCIHDIKNNKFYSRKEPLP